MERKEEVMELDLRNVKRYMILFGKCHVEGVQTTDFDLLTLELAHMENRARDAEKFVSNARVLLSEYKNSILRLVKDRENAEAALTAAESAREEAVRDADMWKDQAAKWQDKVADAVTEMRDLRSSLAALREERKQCVRVDVLLRWMDIEIKYQMAMDMNEDEARCCVARRLKHILSSRPQSPKGE
jgi:hypothetical protein